MTTVKKAPAKKETVGSLIDEMHNVREKIRVLNEQISALEAEKSTIEIKLIPQMKEEGLSKSTGRAASASITETVRPSVVDWDAFYEYIRKNKYYHLLERRPSVTGCRELFESKGKIPGVEPFIKETINLRSI